MSVIGSVIVDQLHQHQQTTESRSETVSLRPL
jgi:hypothetical protein